MTPVILWVLVAVVAGVPTVDGIVDIDKPRFQVFGTEQVCRAAEGKIAAQAILRAPDNRMIGAACIRVIESRKS